jgi:hypothetical protein
MGEGMASAARKADDVGPEVFSDELKPGTQLLHGQFTIESFLNSGGFGITYLARDSLDRLVVIKECFPGSFCRRSNTIVGARSRAHQVEFRSIVKLFVQEAFNLSKLKHPHIVGVHQVFEDNDTAYMAMDYIEGFDLLETLEEGATRLTPDEIVGVLKKVLAAVGFVHSRGLLHRDISPDNILMDKATGNPVLIDFGAAREEVSKASRALSAMRVVKDGYSPQEFYINGSAQGPWSDLYAVAATFYHLITGKTPINSQTRLSAVASRDPDPYAPLSGSVTGYPPAFLKAIDKAIRIFPKDRIQSADAWLALIAPDADGMAEPVSVLRVPSARVVSERVAVASAAVTRSRKLVLLASAAAVVVVGLAAWQGGAFDATDRPVIATATAAERPEAGGEDVKSTVAARPVETAVDPVIAAVDVAAAKSDATKEGTSPVTVAVVPPGPSVPPVADVADVADAVRTGRPVVEVAVAQPVGLAPKDDVSAEPPAKAVVADVTPVSPTADPVVESATAGVDPVPVGPTPTLKVTLSLAVSMPFATDAVQKNLITSVQSGAPVWMQPGQRIVEVNGLPVRSSADLREIMGRGADLSAWSDVPVIFGVQAFEGADTIYKTEALPVVDYMVLDTGLAFEILTTAVGPQTVVSAVAAGSDTDLQVGDVLIAYTATQERIDLTNPLAAILSREIEKRVANYSFSVQRDGGMIVASFAVPVAS